MLRGKTSIQDEGENLFRLLNQAVWDRRILSQQIRNSKEKSELSSSEPSAMLKGIAHVFVAIPQPRQTADDYVSVSEKTGSCIWEVKRDFTPRAE
jgi:hypothetical protein